jgi:integrase
MSPKRSKYAHARYSNLYKLPNQPCWIYRRYSSEKGEEFYCSTGLEASERNAPAAYKIGVEKFNDWLGAFTPTDGSSLMRDLLRINLAAKDEDPEIKDTTYRTVRNQTENHLIPACGHLKPSQITTEWWLNYQRAERTKPTLRTFRDGRTQAGPPRKALANTRKTLSETLGLAMRRGLLDKMPELPLNDPESAPARYIPKEDILRLIRFAGRIAGRKRYRAKYGHDTIRESRYRAFRLKLLILWMWKMGARPSEILQYRWDMIHWDKGTIAIPGPITKNKTSREILINPKVLRVLRFLRGKHGSPWVFPSPVKPGEPMKDYNKAWTTVNARLGLDFDIYNLRDTYITDQLEAGMSTVFIGKYVQNSAAMIEKTYASVILRVMAKLAGFQNTNKGVSK